LWLPVNIPDRVIIVYFYYIHILHFQNIIYFLFPLL